MNTNLYVLSDGYNFYIGKADDVNHRYVVHMREAFYDEALQQPTRKEEWFQSYGSIEEARIYIQVIRTFVIPYDEWEEYEIAEIARYREEYGYDRVMNDTEGGES